LIPRRVVECLRLHQLHLIEVFDRDLFLTDHLLLSASSLGALRGPLLNLIHHLLMVPLKSAPQMHVILLVALESGATPTVRAKLRVACLIQTG
jgi:hypothetical protein